MPNPFTYKFKNQWFSIATLDNGRVTIHRLVNTKSGGFCYFVDEVDDVKKAIEVARSLK